MRLTYALFTKCELNNPLIMQLQRISGLSGRYAMIDGGDERRQWAVRIDRHKGRIAELSTEEMLQQCTNVCFGEAAMQRK